MLGNVFGNVSANACAMVVVVLLAGLHREPSPALASDPAWQPPAILIELEDRFTRIAAQTEPGVVSIRIYIRDPAWYETARLKWEERQGWQQSENDDLRYENHRPVAGGSGFIVDPDGYIFTTRSALLNPLTNEIGDLIDVEIEDTAHEPARLVHADPELDLAVIRVVTKWNLQPLELGSSGTVRPGQWALAFGDPDGPEKTLRISHVVESSPVSLRTSLPVPQEAHGGPVVDIRGHVIAISRSRGTGVIRSDVLSEAPGFNIPVDVATSVYRGVVSRETREKPYLGLSLVSLSPQLRSDHPGLPPTGLYVDGVDPVGPAAEAGMRLGDVLIRVDEHRVLTPFDFEKWIEWHGVGGRPRLQVLREGERTVVEATLTAAPR